MAESFWQFLLELFEAVDSANVAAKREIARVEQDVLGSQLQDGLRMRADHNPRVGNPPQHGVQDIPSSSAFDGIAPDQHEAAVAQLRLHFFGEVVVVHGRDRRHAGEGESIKQRSKPALGRIRAIPHAAIAWIK